MALFCQSVLTEQNGSVSVIRAIDTYTVAGPGEQMQPTIVPVTLVIAMKAGDMQGKSTVSLQGNLPSGGQLPTLNFPVFFESGDRGVGIVAPIGLQLTEDGLYWFDVLVNGIQVTRISLRVLYQRVAATLPFGPKQP